MDGCDDQNVATKTKKRQAEKRENEKGLKRVIPSRRVLENHPQRRRSVQTKCHVVPRWVQRIVANNVAVLVLPVVVAAAAVMILIPTVIGFVDVAAGPGRCRRCRCRCCYSVVVDCIVVWSFPP